MKQTISFTLSLICLLPRVVAAADIPPIPGLSAWEAHMKDNARIVAAQPADADAAKIDEGFIWYYDGIFVFHQIAQYTKDDSWLTVAAKCRHFYRDGYVIGCKKYSVDGWELYPRAVLRLDRAAR